MSEKNEVKEAEERLRKQRTSNSFCFKFKGKLHSLAK